MSALVEAHHESCYSVAAFPADLSRSVFLRGPRVLMMKKVATSLYGWVLLVSAYLLLSASPASAQYKPQPLNDPATGEDYFVEGTVNLWFPTASMQVSSESLGQVPTLIDAKGDLGLQDKK